VIASTAYLAVRGDPEFLTPCNLLYKMAKKTLSPYPLTPRTSFSVMPEVFNQASMFLLLLWFLKTVDP
ncbi:MAG: hypothetical protein WBH59_03345, partial [Atribacterales bacterium]